MSSFFYPSLVSITLPQLSKVDVIHSSLITLKRELKVVSGKKNEEKYKKWGMCLILRFHSYLLNPVYIVDKHYRPIFQCLLFCRKLYKRAVIVYGHCLRNCVILVSYRSFYVIIFQKLLVLLCCTRICVQSS